jgi:hypothetical protein
MRAMGAVPDAFERSTAIRATADILGQPLRTSDICR